MISDRLLKNKSFKKVAIRLSKYAVVLLENQRMSTFQCKICSQWF